jgi:hypothetical protein
MRATITIPTRMATDHHDVTATLFIPASGRVGAKFWPPQR